MEGKQLVALASKEAVGKPRGQGCDESFRELKMQLGLADGSQLSIVKQLEPIFKQLTPGDQ